MKVNSHRENPIGSGFKKGETAEVRMDCHRVLSLSHAHTHPRASPLLSGPTCSPASSPPYRPPAPSSLTLQLLPGPARSSFNACRAAVISGQREDSGEKAPPSSSDAQPLAGLLPQRTGAQRPCHAHERWMEFLSWSTELSASPRL